MSETIINVLFPVAVLSAAVGIFVYAYSLESIKSVFINSTGNHSDS